MLYLVDGHWGNWSNYETCSKTCGSGTQSRFRTCLYDSVAPHGVACPGVNSQRQTCNSNACPGMYMSEKLFIFTSKIYIVHTRHINPCLSSTQDDQSLHKWKFADGTLRIKSKHIKTLSIETDSSLTFLQIFPLGEFKCMQLLKMIKLWKLSSNAHFCTVCYICVSFLQLW